MAKYQVPQFLEIEDKIFGSLTLKQFLYVAAGASLMFIAWTTLPKFLAVIIGVPILIFFVALAFLKVNNKPLSYTIENAIKFTMGNKLYLWKKKDDFSIEDITKNAAEAEATPYSAKVPKLSDSKLKDLSWGLDIKDHSIKK